MITMVKSSDQLYQILIALYVITLFFPVQVKLANFETTQTVAKTGTQIKGTYNFDFTGNQLSILS